MLHKIDFTLDDVLREESYITPASTYRDITSTSIEELNKNLKISNPLYFKYGHSNQKKLDREKLNKYLLTNFLTKNYGGEWNISGSFKYEKGDFMGWHTNNNNQGIRCYFAYSFEDNSNIFRYRNPYTKKVIDSYDKKGWNIRLFQINKENPFWHCVIANSDRYSFGFNNKNPSKKLMWDVKLCYQSQ